MVDSGATNSFVHIEVVLVVTLRQLGAVSALRQTLAEGLYVNCSNNIRKLSES